MAGARLEGVAAAIIAGGKATRMGGRPKSLALVGGRRIVDRQLDVLRPLFAELFVVANDPEPWRGLGLPVIGDPPEAEAGQGPLLGIWAAAAAARADRVVVVACDMPELDERALRLVADPDAPEDVIVPIADGRPEPLHARYGRACVEPIRRRLGAGDRKITSFFADVRVRRIEEPALRALDADLRFLRNCNLPEELS
jgi:molybdopterin-guanine dinucleotide biosynthesis protein A